MTDQTTPTSGTPDPTAAEHRSEQDIPAIYGATAFRQALMGEPKVVALGLAVLRIEARYDHDPAALAAAVLAAVEDYRNDRANPPSAAEQPRVLTLPDGWESRGQSASPWGAHHGVICDALEFLWTKTTTRRAEIEEALRSAGEWHNHDQEEAHCDPGCPAWQFYGGGYCAACGEQHTTVQPHPDLTLTDDIQATEVAR